MFHYNMIYVYNLFAIHLTEFSNAVYFVSLFLSVKFIRLFWCRLFFNLHFKTYIHIYFPNKNKLLLWTGFKTLEVVSGRQDVYFHSTLIKKWDICAGNAILKHFKGHMTTLEGKNIDYSDPFDYKNPYGLVASLNHHSFYLKKLQNL